VEWAELVMPVLAIGIHGQIKWSNANLSNDGAETADIKLSN